MDTPPHPLNRIARERALRHELIRRPELIGLAELAVAPPPVPRINVGRVAVRGHGEDGRRRGRSRRLLRPGSTSTSCRYAADAREALGPATAPLLLALRAADDQPVTRQLAARLVHPATVIAVS